MMRYKLRSVALVAGTVLALLFDSSSASAFKIGYSGIPLVVEDFPAVHEAVTSEAMRYACSSVGIDNFNRSRFFRSFLRATVARCEDLRFDAQTVRWRDQMRSSLIADLLFGARFPDLREMTGVDANRQDAVVVRYDDEVQIDAYRLYPQFHGQLSKFHNIWGGDMELGMESIRSFVRASFHEVAALSLTFDGATPRRNDFVASNAMLDHDANRTTDQLVFDVRWHAVLMGIVSHAIEDAFSHDPLFVLDPAQNRVVHEAVFYGKFTDATGAAVEVPSLYPRIDAGMAATTDGIANMRPVTDYTPAGPLRMTDIPATVNSGGQELRNWFEADGKRYGAGTLATTISMYAVAELLMAIDFAVAHVHEPMRVDAALAAYMDKYFAANFHPFGLSPRRTQDVGATDARYARLPWYDYHFVDLWTQSGLADRTVDGKQAFCLPWSDRASMGDILTRADVDTHFVLLPSQREAYDEAKRIWEIDRNTLYVFRSWYRADAAYVRRVPLDARDFYENQAGAMVVREREIEVDGSAVRGLDEVYASAWVPAGYRLCVDAPSQATPPAALTPRTTMFDTTRPLYRCFYGAAEGRWVHIEFHLRQGARLLVLPIDADQDGAPYLRGLFDDVYRDNCPLAANPDQADRDGDGIGDICDDCPDVAGTCSDGGNDAGTADGGFDGGGGTSDGGTPRDVGTSAEVGASDGEMADAGLADSGTGGGRGEASTVEDGPSTPDGVPAGGARDDAPTVDAASGGTTQGNRSTGGCGCRLAGTPQGTSIHLGFIAVTFLTFRRRKGGKSARLRRDAHRFDGGPRRRQLAHA